MTSGFSFPWKKRRRSVFSQFLPPSERKRNKPSPPSVPRRTKPSPCRISGSDEKPSTSWTAVSAGGESLCGVRQSIENTEARLLEKHRDVKVMQKYISFLVEDLQDESKKQEQSELDDIAGIRHGSPKEGRR